MAPVTSLFGCGGLNAGRIVGSLPKSAEIDIFHFALKVDLDASLVLELATRYTLTSYDASYVALAKTQGLSVAASDQKMATAAFKKRHFEAWRNEA